MLSINNRDDRNIMMNYHRTKDMINLINGLFEFQENCVSFLLDVKAFLYCPETDGIWCPRTAGENGMLL